MEATQKVYIDPDTNESKFDIIRDTTGDIQDKSWLNRYCKDVKTEVLDIFTFADHGRTLFIIARQQTTGNLSSIVAVKKGQ